MVVLTNMPGGSLVCADACATVRNGISRYMWSFELCLLLHHCDVRSFRLASGWAAQRFASNSYVTAVSLLICGCMAGSQPRCAAQVPAWQLNVNTTVPYR